MKVCQSCGMPMSKDVQGGGSEKNGSKSAIYCSHCYRDGAFTAPDITALDMQKFCMEHMQKDMKMPKFLAWLFTRSIPGLKRWK